MPKKSNRTIALESLKPYWDKIENINTKPIVILKRGKDTGKQTMGNYLLVIFGKNIRAFMER